MPNDIGQDVVTLLVVLSVRASGRLGCQFGTLFEHTGTIHGSDWLNRGQTSFSNIKQKPTLAGDESKDVVVQFSERRISPVLVFDGLEAVERRCVTLVPIYTNDR